MQLIRKARKDSFAHTSKLQKLETGKSGRSKKFIKDVGIYAIGNIGSKLITFLMIPFYTFFIDSSDFGYYDLCLQTVLLLLPFATLQLRDGVFRFLVDCRTDEERSGVIGLSIKIISTVLLLFFLLTIGLSITTTIRYAWYTFGFLVAISLHEVFGQMARGLNHTKVFMLSNILSAFFIGIFSIIFVAVFNLGIEGIFLANILARLVAVAYIEFTVGPCHKFFKLSYRNHKLRNDLLRYSLPLLPGAICWWLTNGSDRFFIEHFLSLSDNGVYAVAFRFSSILQILSTIFYQAWQDTAYRQFDSDDRDRFFSEMFNNYIHALALILLCFAFGLKLVYPWIVAPEYQEGANYLYPMGVASILYAASAFLEVEYQCARETARALPGIITAAAVNIILNYFLIQAVGIYGVVITAVITYVVLLVCRLSDMRRYFKLSFHARTLFPIAISVIGLIPFYWSTIWWLDIAYSLTALTILAMALPPAFRNRLSARILRRNRPQNASGK